MKTCDIKLSLWGWDGIVVVGGTQDDFRKFAKKTIGAEIDEHDTQVAGRAYIQADTVWLIWVEDPKNIATLAHEALHITFGVLETRGLTPNEGSEEAYTYTLGSILHQVQHAKWKKVK